MRVQISFHGPFRVESGVPPGGVVAAADPEDLLPASSLKGVMRAAASLLLPGRKDLVTEVFGGGGRPSPWHWGPVHFDPPPTSTRRARIAIDPASGTARPDYLVFGHAVWARTAVFDITAHRPLESAVAALHLTVLAGAAAAVHGLGADRRRGMGWVTLRPVDPPLDDARLAAIDELAAPAWQATGEASRA